MATITEDYVSFEIALLLKKKGFEQAGCQKQYNTQGDLCVGYCYGPVAPTLQMAMKWLRDIHGWFIHIDVIREASCWLADIQDIKNDVAIYPIKDEFPNYEEAVEAAIKYCLENLI